VIGMTQVSCTAADASGNSASGSFRVTVNGAPAQLNKLIAVVQGFNLAQGIENGLDAKLQNARDALSAASAGDRATAGNLLGAFINEVQAQTGKKITPQQADQLIPPANRIRAVLGHP
jgi:hypothetical protein